MENCIPLMPSEILIWLFPELLRSPTSWNSCFKSLGAAEERWVSLAVSPAREAGHSLLSLFPYGKDPSPAFSLICGTLWGGVMLAEFLLPTFMYPKLYFFLFLPVECWNFSSRVLDFFKGFLIHGCLPKLVFSRCYS